MLKVMLSAAVAAGVMAAASSGAHAQKKFVFALSNLPVLWCEEREGNRKWSHVLELEE